MQIRKVNTAPTFSRVNQTTVSAITPTQKQVTQRQPEKLESSLKIEDIQNDIEIHSDIPQSVPQFPTKKTTPQQKQVIKPKESPNAAPTTKDSPQAPEQKKVEFAEETEEFTGIYGSKIHSFDIQKLDQQIKDKINMTEAQPKHSDKPKQADKQNPKPDSKPKSIQPQSIQTTTKQSVLHKPSTLSTITTQKTTVKTESPKTTTQKKSVAPKTDMVKKLSQQKEALNKMNPTEQELGLRRTQQLQYLALLARKERLMRLDASRNSILDTIHVLKEKVIELQKVKSEKEYSEVVYPLLTNMNQELLEESKHLQALPMDYIQDKIQNYFDLTQYFNNQQINGVRVGSDLQCQEDLQKCEEFLRKMCGQLQDGVGAEVEGLDSIQQICERIQVLQYEVSSLML
ncbi:Conserved_hypothetical protein [Hexamita inflata]|uniref:Uncharacterized protein n=1 Tax=Hexamita inflata TaxID=28002 RepID=A0AA86Q672_9EUKA|nr:Conserved hypothetical protein [Hexamita inflata]